MVAQCRGDAPARLVLRMLLDQDPEFAFCSCGIPGIEVRQHQRHAMGRFVRVQFHGALVQRHCK